MFCRWGILVPLVLAARRGAQAARLSRDWRISGLAGVIAAARRRALYPSRRTFHPLVGLMRAGGALGAGAVRW